VRARRVDVVLNIVAEFEDHETGGKAERRYSQAMMAAAAEETL
jgi:hypothetical protein